jgi:hypothetical protein
MESTAQNSPKINEYPAGFSRLIGISPASLAPGDADAARSIRKTLFATRD